MQKGRTARHSLFYCKLKLVDLFHQGVQKLSFRHLADDLTFFENEALSLAAGNAEVGLARFAGAVDNTAHDGNGDVLINVFECLFDLIGKADEIDTCSAAGGAGNKLYAAAQRETRSVSPMPRCKRLPMPMADLTIPMRSVPVSVTPRCSG